MSLEIGQEWILYTTPFRLKEVSAAPTGGEIIPDVVSFYAKDNGSGVSTLCYKTDAGTEICLPTVGPIITGSGVAGQVTLFTSTATIGGDTGLTFNSTTDMLSVGGLTLGSILFAGASGLISQDNTNLFWDDTNNRLGIGTNSPGTPLDILVTATLDPGIRLRSASSQGVNISAVNSAGSAQLWAAGTTDDFITGSAAGDAGIRYAVGKRFLFGPAAGPKYLIGASGELGIGGATFGTANSIFTSNGSGAAPSWNSTLVVTTVTMSGLTLGSVVFAGTAGILSQDNSKFFWDNTNKRLGIGGTVPGTSLSVQDTVTTTARGIRAEQFSADAVSANINFAKSRNATVGSHTALNTDDIIGNLGFMGSDGSSFGAAQANILCFAGENWSSTNKGTYLAFRTTPLASTTVAERLRIDAAGDIILKTATAKLDLSAISAGNPNLKITATSDTPATTWTAGVPSNNPAGYMEILAGANTRYIPFWT